MQKVLLFLITNEIKTFICYSFVDFGPNSILYVCFVDIIFCIKLLLQTEYAALQYIYKKNISDIALCVPVENSGS